MIALFLTICVIALGCGLLAYAACWVAVYTLLGAMWTVQQCARLIGQAVRR